jgi:hypothetical protein
MNRLPSLRGFALRARPGLIFDALRGWRRHSKPDSSLQQRLVRTIVAISPSPLRRESYGIGPPGRCRRPDRRRCCSRRHRDHSRRKALARSKQVTLPGTFDAECAPARVVIHQRSSRERREARGYARASTAPDQRSAAVARPLSRSRNAMLRVAGNGRLHRVSWAAVARAR